MNELKAILSQFKPVSLAEIDEVKLMNRIDRKYWFHIFKLKRMLLNLMTQYHIIEMNGLDLVLYKEFNLQNKF